MAGKWISKTSATRCSCLNGTVSHTFAFYYGAIWQINSGRITSVSRAGPGKWSKQELLGHLIDSAMYNLKRFTEAQFMQQPYTIIPYQQNELVAVNQYQHLPITHLLHLWNTLNQQIIFIVKEIPAEMLKYEVVPQYNATGTKTVAWLICDYVAHMDHHLGPDTWQSFPDTGRD